MQQFIPFEDEWDMLDAIRPEALIPYRVGLVLAPSVAGGAAQSTAPTLPSIASTSPSRTPIRFAVPADSSST